MTDRKRALRSELGHARRELQAAQARVAELENQMILPQSELSSANYRATFDTMLEGCQIISFDWRYLYLNDSAARYGRQPKNELLGRVMMECYLGIETTEMFAALERCMNKRTNEDAEFEFIYPDGDSAWFECRIQPVPEGLLILTLDITKHKAQERQLRYAASIQASVSDAVIATDMEMRIQSWNHAAEIIYGWSEAEVLGKTVAEVLRTNYKSEAERQQLIQNLLMKGTWSGEVMQYRQDNSLLNVHASVSLFKDQHGQASGIVSVNRDVTAQKQAEANLRESEEKFRLLVEAAPMAIIICNEVGQITLINQQTEVLFGYSRDELIGQLVEMLVPSSIRDHHLQYRVNYVDAPKVRPMQGGQKFQLYRKDGSLFLAEIELSYIHTRAGLQIISFVMDVTKRQQIEQAVREQRDFLQLVIDNVPDLIVVKDRTGHLQLVNQVAADMYGRTTNELIGKTDADLNPDPALAKTFVEQDQMVLRTGKPLFIPEETDHQNYYQTTKIPLLNAAGDYDRLLVVASDITKRKRAEAALRESEERFRLIVNNVRDYAIYMLDPDGYIASWNLGASQIKGYSTDEIIGQHFSLFYTPEDRLRGEPKRVLDIARSEGHFVGEGWRMRKDGTHFWASIVLTALRNDKGEIIGFSKVTGDLTKRKKTEETLQQALIREQELNELKSRFVSMASHEFRTPLATILSLAETLSTYRHKLTEDQIELRLRRIREEIGYLTEIMDDVVQIARLQARRAEFKPTLVDLDALCRSIIDEALGGQKHTHVCHYTCDRAITPILLDRKLMRQIISNLLANAIKYSSPASEIIINLGRTEHHLVIKVTDQGIGIPEADLKHLFEPFHRAENVGTIPGAGLGLTITKESIELHGGSIEVDSQINVGTTFTITLPFSATGAEPHDPNSRD